MSKGSPIVKFRIPYEAHLEMMLTIKRLNRKRKEEPFTVSSFLMSCLVERLDKLDRGRNPPKKVFQERLVNDGV